MCKAEWLKKNFFFNVYFFIFARERERASEHYGGGAEIGGQRIWSLFRADSTEPDAGLELTNCEIVTWAEVRRSTDWATQAPQILAPWANILILALFVVVILFFNTIFPNDL